MNAISGGATADEAAVQVRAVLGGEVGARRDMVLLNAAGALFAADRVGSLREGVEMARELIDSGKALAKLDQLAAYCRQ
jgi:anthranilate phosphoribosyltransferase